MLTVFGEVLLGVFAFGGGALALYLKQNWAAIVGGVDAAVAKARVDLAVLEARANAVKAVVQPVAAAPAAPAPSAAPQA